MLIHMMSPSRILIWRGLLLLAVVAFQLGAGRQRYVGRRYKVSGPKLYRYKPRFPLTRHGHKFYSRKIYSSPTGFQPVRGTTFSRGYPASPTSIRRYAAKPTRHNVVVPTSINRGIQRGIGRPNFSIPTYRPRKTFLSHRIPPIRVYSTPSRFTVTNRVTPYGTMGYSSPYPYSRVPTKPYAPTRKYVSASPKSYVPPSTRKYVAPTTKNYVTPTTRKYLTAPSKVFVASQPSVQTVTRSSDRGNRVDPDLSTNFRPRDAKLARSPVSNDLESARSFDVTPTSKNFHHKPTTRKQSYAPTKPASVLRIQTTSMAEAQNLVKGLGAGFKVTFVKTHPNHVALLKDSRQSSGDDDLDSLRPRSTSNANNSRKAESSARRDTSGLHKTWWKGKHVCVSESPGLFGLSFTILKKIKTEEKCRERRYKYICVEKYGFGGRRPRKTITYRCCADYHINEARTECQPVNFRRRSDLTDPALATVTRGGLPELPASVSAPPSDEKLTVFMPNDEVLVEALSVNSENQSSEGNDVQEFLENHVIPNKTLLSTEINDNQIFHAISGNPIRVNFFASDIDDDVMTVNCKKVSVRDVVNENSVVYFIDDIIDPVKGNAWDYLISAAREFSQLIDVLNRTGLRHDLTSQNRSMTLLAPSNEAFDRMPASHKHGNCLKVIMRNHLLSRVACTPAVEVHSRRFVTKQGQNLTMRSSEGKVFIQDKAITKKDVMTSNAVIHVINRVLEPPSIASVLDVMLSDSRLTDAVEILQAAGISNVLTIRSNFTIVAPTNKAFKKFGRASIIELLSNRERLVRLERFHVIPEAVTLADVRSRDSLATLVPAARTQVGKYKRNVRVLHNGRKRLIRKNALSLQCARILRRPRLEPCNGAVLVVDRVLVPPSGDLLAELSRSHKSNFSIILGAIHKSGIRRLFEAEGSFTFFAPTNKAFKRLAPHVFRALMSKSQRLRQIIKLHLVRGSHCSISLMQRSRQLRSLIGYSITSCPKRKRLMLGRRRKRLRARVTESDLLATNGILYGIDNILLPRRFRL